MKVVLGFVLWIISFHAIYGQAVHGADECMVTKIQEWRGQNKNTVASPEENRYDVKHLHLELELDNTSVYIKSGKAATTVQVLEPNFGLYVTELKEVLALDSVFINGQPAAFSHVADLVYIFTQQPMPAGEVFTVTLYYHGMPPAGTVFSLQNGMNNALSTPWAAPITYSLSQPYNAKDWWPAKQSLTDKIDSADIWVTVPDSLMAGSNGLLKNVIILGGNKKRYEWKTNYPTSYYLLSVAVGNYRDYSYNVTLPDGNIVPVQNYIYNRPGILDTFKTRIDTTGLMLQLFSELFGTYPFYKEKYGHCMSPVFGGMEHQTMTTLLHFNTPLVSHELGHQWFGDNVTCASWRDIWLNEGFASYAEYLFAEKYRDEKGALNYMQRVHNTVLNDTNKAMSIYLDAGDTANVYRIFDGVHSYLKPSAVLHTLRFLINDDVAFFNILKQYQRQFADSNADTKAFQQLAEQVAGIELDTFFNEWIYGKGYPIYSIRWNQVEDSIIIEMEQKGSVPESVPQFNIPAEIKLLYQGGHSTTRLNNSTSRRIAIHAGRRINGLVFDPRNTILNRETVVRDYSLGLKYTGNDIAVYPNPAEDEWRVVNIIKGQDIRLTDLSGRVLWQTKVTDNFGIAIPASPYARGIYILTVYNDKKEVTSKKIIKR